MQNQEIQKSCFQESIPSVFESLPNELIEEIIFHTPVKGLVNVALVCKKWFNIISTESLWKRFYFRDYRQYNVISLEEKETIDKLASKLLQFPQLTENNGAMDFLRYLESRNDPENILSISAFSEYLEVINNQYLLFNSWKLNRQWKRLYLYLKTNLIDIEGTWEANYGGTHGIELIELKQQGWTVEMKKLIGDPNIPRNKITMQFPLVLPCDISNFPNLKKHLSTRSTKYSNIWTLGMGRIQLAEHGYREPWWNLAFFTLNNEMQIETNWMLKATVRYPMTFDRLPAISVQMITDAIENVGGIPDSLGNIDNRAVLSHLQITPIYDFR